MRRSPSGNAGSPGESDEAIPKAAMPRVETVLVVGVFDLFHAGHVRLLESARALGDRLVVVVNGDALTASYKRPPIMREEDRAAVIAACRFVDRVEVSNDYSVRDIVVREGVTQIVHGDDWEIESYKRQIRCDDDFLARHGVRLVLLPYTQGISTSDIIATCAARATRAGAALGR